MSALVYLGVFNKLLPGCVSVVQLLRLIPLNDFICSNIPLNSFKRKCRTFNNLGCAVIFPVKQINVSKYGCKSSAESASSCGRDLLCKYRIRNQFGTDLVACLNNTTSSEEIWSDDKLLLPSAQTLSKGIYVLVCVAKIKFVKMIFSVPAVSQWQLQLWGLCWSGS